MKGTDMEATGLEPVTSRVWGERSSRLSYGSKYLIILQPRGKSVNRRAWFNVKLQDEEYNDEYHLIPKFNPENYKVFEIKEGGTEISLQDKDGNIGKNYFNILMGSVMDDYYDCLNFYETSTEAQK